VSPFKAKYFANREVGSPATPMNLVNLTMTMARTKGTIGQGYRYHHENPAST
jgi:hypothetical protein